MKEWSDEELDKLFRASAEEFEAEYQPSDWHSLRRRLDEADGVAGGGWLKSMAPWVAGVLLLLLGGMGRIFMVTKMKVIMRESVGREQSCLLREKGAGNPMPGRQGRMAQPSVKVKQARLAKM